MHKNHLIITNWPLGVPPPGPGFDFKKLKASSLHRLVVPYLHRKLGIMYDGQSDKEDAEDALGDLSEIEVKLWHEGLLYCKCLVSYAHMLCRDYPHFGYEPH